MPLFAPGFILGLARLWPLGLSPVAPGTVASLVSTLSAPWLFLPLSLPLRLALLALLFVIGALVAGYTENTMGLKDPSSVVIDELVGQWLALLPLLNAWQLYPAPGSIGPSIGPGASQTPLLFLLLGFILFRLFDITKPWLVKASESWLPGGWGIMIDDVIAGFFALCVLLALLKSAALLWS